MKVVVKEWQAVAQWQWDTGKKEDDSAEDGEEDADEAEEASSEV